MKIIILLKIFVLCLTMLKKRPSINKIPGVSTVVQWVRNPTAAAWVLQKHRFYPGTAAATVQFAAAAQIPGPGNFSRPRVQPLKKKKGFPKPRSSLKGSMVREHT